MKLRLYHHRDGARVAYREAGMGAPLAILHSGFLSHKEWEPLIPELVDRFRVVLPDLPLHGDSEDRGHHPYTPEWLGDVMSAFVRDVAGPRPLVAGHGLGAEILVDAVAAGLLAPSRLVLMPNRMHGPEAHQGMRALWRAGTRLGALPGAGLPLSHAARAVFRPQLASRLSAGSDLDVRDVVRHAFADVGGNAQLAQGWARFAATWPAGPQRARLDAYSSIACRTLLLWADRDEFHPLAYAEEALDLLPDAQLRVLPRTGYLMAYDDPVGVARELAAFCLG